MIFVDSGAWFANAVTGDADHQAARQWFKANTLPLITSDFVIDETLTLLRARGENTNAVRLGAGFFEGGLVEIEYVTRQDLHESWRIFRDYSDKDWSFTDCTSKVLMQRLRIKKAFAFDQHFRQFGDVEVVP